MSEEKAQQLLYQIQILESYFADLTTRENSLINLLREAASAIESIKTLNQQPDSDTLVPMGLGAFVKAKISSNEKLILNLGAGAAIEKDKDSTINYIEARIKEMEVALNETVNKKREVMSSLEQGKHEMNRLIHEARSKKP